MLLVIEIALGIVLGLCLTGVLKKKKNALLEEGDMNDSDKINEVKDHLVQISAQLVELAASVSRLEKHVETKERTGVASLQELESAARHAIDECRATSSGHLDEVMRAARAGLEAKAYNADTLRDFGKNILEAKRR